MIPPMKIERVEECGIWVVTWPDGSILGNYPKCWIAEAEAIEAHKAREEAEAA